MPYDGLAGCSVLVVDDEDVFLTSVVEGLESAFPGLESFTATDGESALQILEQHSVDLVITDLSMPRMDGMALVAAMVSKGMRTPVIMATAYGARALSSDARDHGVVAVLDKPIDFAVLLKICRETLESSKSGRSSGVTLTGLLYLLRMEGRSCTIRTFCEEGTGEIAVEAGRVVRCTRADDSGASALRWILSRRDTEVELERQARPRETTIPDSAQGDARDDLKTHDALEAMPPAFDSTDMNERSDLDRFEKERTMANVEQSITQAMNIQGCLAAALVDYESGMCLGSRAQGFPIEVAAAGNTEVLRSKMRVMSELGIDGGISDILITLDTQYHLIVPMTKGTLFLYIAIDRKSGNLAMARHKLTSIEKELSV